MAAVHAAIRLVSPIETTIHSGEIIGLLPGKSGTINLFSNSEMDKEETNNSEFKKYLDSFIESFGDEFKDQEDFVKPVLIRTGAHFRFRGDKQFVTVVYSGSGRMVFNFDSDSHTNPMQKLYVDDQLFVVTNRDGNGNNLHLGYSLFDIPACTSEIQTDILVDLSLISSPGSTPASKGSTSPSTPSPSLTDEDEKILAKYFLDYANRERKKKGPDGNSNDVIQSLKGNDILEDDQEVTFVTNLSTQFDFGKDGYDVYDEETKTLKNISINDYKETIKNLRKEQYFNNNKAKLGSNDPPNNKENRTRLAMIMLGLPEDCIPEELLVDEDELPAIKEERRKIINEKIQNCDQMRVTP